MALPSRATCGSPTLRSRVRDERELPGGVVDDVGLDVGDVDDRLPVGAPPRRLVGAGVGRQLPRRPRAARRVGGDHPDVGVVVRVGVGAAVGDERDGVPVGTPRRVGLVVGAGGDLGERAARHREHVEVRAQSVEIPGPVPLELQPRDHLGSRALAGPGRGERIANREHEPGAVRRPLVSIHALRDVGERPRFAAAAVEGPHLRLGLAGRIRRRAGPPRPRRQEREVAAVGTPPGLTRRVARCRERDGAAGGPRVQRGHPQRRLAAVGLEIESPHDIGDPAAVGADLRIPDLLQGEQIIDGERPLGRRRWWWRSGARARRVRAA